MSPSLFWHFMRLRLRERMEYRGAFIIGALAQMLGWAAHFTVIWLLVNRFETIAGWNWEEIAFLYSLNMMTYAVGAAFTYSQMTELESMIQRGTFDGVLVRPLNPYAALSAQMFNVGYISHVVLASGILIWSIGNLDIAWTPLSIFFLLLALAGGSLIQAAILTLLGAWAFTFVRAGFLFGLAGALRWFITYPLSIYGAAVQILLTTLVPFAFINFYPTASLLAKDGQLFPGWVGWLTPLVGLLVFDLAYRVWMRGVDRYQGAGG